MIEIRLRWPFSRLCTLTPCCSVSYAVPLNEGYIVGAKAGRLGSEVKG